MGNFFVSNLYAIDKSLKVDIFQPGQQKFDPVIPIAIVVIIVSAIIISILVRWIKGRKVSDHLQLYEKTKSQGALAGVHLTEESTATISAIAELSSKLENELAQDNTVFEKAILQIRQTSQNNPILEKTQALREELGFIFYNRRYKFLCSQMLQPSQKLRAGIKVRGKLHSFVTTVIQSSEHELWIKPPTNKGKVVDLSKFRSMEFRLFRKGDGEYMFISKVKKQIAKPIAAVCLVHSNRIKKLARREYDRFELRFEQTFLFLVNESEITQGGEYNGVPVPAKVIDISMGGMKFETSECPINSKSGTNLVFKLADSAIKKEIHASIVRLNATDNNTIVHIKFDQLSELNRLHIHKFIASKRPVKIKEPEMTE